MTDIQRIKDIHKILVTGSTGFIGSQLCRALVAEGLQVRAFHRTGSSTAALEGLAVEHATGDITRPETLAKAMQGIEVVFHTAAMLGRSNDRFSMYAVNVEGTRNVLRIAGEAGVKRVVYTSSVAALGVPEELPGESGLSSASESTYLLMDERHTWNYRPEWWPYGHSKYQAEMAVQEAVALGLDVVIVNPAIVIGAGDLNRVAGNVVIHVARGHLPMAVPGGLNAIHIDDVIRGHLAALTSGRTGERYILGGENMTHLRFLQLIAEVTKARLPHFVLPKRLVRVMARPISAAGSWLPLPIHGNALRRAGYYFYYDTTKARVELGLTNALPTRTAVVEAFDWYREHGLL